MAGARCIEPCVPQGMELSVLISIFAQIAGVSTDPNSLMAGAVCIDRCIPKGIQDAALISILNQIVEGGGPSDTPGTPSLSGVLDGGLARLTVTNGTPPATDPPYDWELEGSNDGANWFVVGHYPIDGSEIDIAIILGPYYRIHWRQYVDLPTVYGSYSNIVFLGSSANMISQDGFDLDDETGATLLPE